jgi:hypothetical protein
MSDHPWLRSLDVTALCPKCKVLALRRSHTRTKFERFKREHSGMRIFRCHACSWRGWLDESKLRYSNTSDGEAHFLLEEGLDAIPDIALDPLGKAPTAAPRLRPDDLPAVARPRLNEYPEELSLPLQEPEENHHSSPDLPASDRSFSRIQEETVEVDNAPSTRERKRFPGEEELQPFDEDLKPYSHQEGEQFHSQSRHKGKPCPSCGEYTLFRSRHRNVTEMLRKKFTGKRPYRCHKCRWRGWLAK